MKNTNKYIKTRGQITAAEGNKVSALLQLALTNAHKKSTSNNGKDQELPINNMTQKLHKTKKIYKNKQSNALINHVKSAQATIKAQSKQKQKIPPKINHVKIGKTSSQKKIKIQQEKPTQSNPRIKIETKNENKKMKTLTDYHFTMNPANQQITTQNNNVNDDVQKNKISIKKKQSKAKMEIKLENIQNQRIKVQNQSVPKTTSKFKKFKNESKLIQELQPPQINHIQQQINIIPAQQPRQQIKKKGRPKKIIQPILESRSPEEHVKLEEFIQNAIKLRKLKNQKQFFESFSRINQYAQESWQYGDLSKDLKWAPQRQEILKIGIPIVRGIRKQIQQQQLLSLAA